MISPAARRIAVAIGLVIVFGIAVATIVVAPAKHAAQNPAAQTAGANRAETFTDQNATNPTAARAAATDQNATPGQAAVPDRTAAADQTAVTEQLRSSIANVAPDSNIVIKDQNGVVALAGSVPSQAVADQARQAAQQVPGVKQVDTSALVVAKR